MLKAGLLLSLFLFLLTYKIVHQFNNPVKPQTDCEIPGQHLHSDPGTHDCDICDYNLTAHVTVEANELSCPPIEAYWENFYTDTIYVQELNRIPARAPPAA